jgi:hypothetical protein
LLLATTTYYSHATCYLLLATCYLLLTTTTYHVLLRRRARGCSSLRGFSSGSLRTARAYSLAAVCHSKYSRGEHGHRKCSHGKYSQHGHSKHARTASQRFVSLPPPPRRRHHAAASPPRRLAAPPAPPAPPLAKPPRPLTAGASCTVGEYVRSFRHKIEREQNKQRSGPGPSHRDLPPPRERV